MKKYLRIFSLVAILAISIVSCSEDFIDLEPNNQVSESVVFGSKKGITAAINGMMSNLIDNEGYYRYELTLQGDVLGGNYKRAENAATNRMQPELVFNFTPSWTNFGVWSNAYSSCDLANKIITKVDEVADMTLEERNFAKGQTLFIRALSHFDLSKVFAQAYNLDDNTIATGANGEGGHLGVIISTEALNDDKPKRSTVKACYDQIIRDLIEAEKLMNAEVLDVFMPSQLAVQALLSRVYLYKQDYENSLIYSNKVISNSKNRVLLDQAAYNASWSEEYSSESIFTVHLYKSHPEFPGNGETLFGLLSEQGTYGDLSISNDLYSLIEDGDVRKSLYYFDSRNTSVIRTAKYNSEESNIPVLRISEIYLNKAEAEYDSNQGAALKTLNIFRTKRGLAAVAFSGVDLLNAIYKERRIELCGEGHQIYDLTRTKRDLIRVDFIDHARKNISYPNKLFVLPIPENELNANPNCEQNPF